MKTTLRPKDAATLVLIRKSSASPEVLLGQRNGGHAFMPNRYVFPGGRVDPSDSRVIPATELNHEVASRLEKNCGPARARALAVAAVRETYEETGLMLAEKMPEGMSTSANPAWSEHQLSVDDCPRYLSTAYAYATQIVLGSFCPHVENVTQSNVPSL